MRSIAIFISVVGILLVGAIGGVTYLIKSAPPRQPEAPIIAPVKVEPMVLDAGAVSQCGDPIVMKARLVNTGDRTFDLTQVVATCGCTVPNLETPLRLEPGAMHDFVVTLDPWALRGPHTQRVDFLYAGGSRGPQLTVLYDVPAGVRTVPGAAHRTSNPDAVVRVTADDGERFVIEGVDPPVVTDWVRTPTSETHLIFDWALVDAAAKSHPDRFEFGPDGVWRRGIVTIQLSRAECPRVQVRVYNSKPTASHSSARETANAE